MTAKTITKTEAKDILHEISWVIKRRLEPDNVIYCTEVNPDYPAIDVIFFRGTPIKMEEIDKIRDIVARELYRKDPDFLDLPPKLEYLITATTFEGYSCLSLTIGFGFVYLLKEEQLPKEEVV